MDVTWGSCAVKTTFHTCQLPSERVTAAGATASANPHARAHDDVSQSATRSWTTFYTKSFPSVSEFQLYSVLRVRVNLHACTWSTDGGFDPSPLQSRNPVNCSLDVLHEDVPVQVKQAEGKFIRHLYDENTDLI